MPVNVDAAAVRRWCAAGLDALRRHRSEIDALNVYPVPDGDTGTNLALTMSAATAAVEAAPGSSSAGELLAVAARGALLGARGNSGIILAQLLKGLATSLASTRAIGPAELAAALERAAASAYAAVAAPVEGTVLSVASAAARAAAGASSRVSAGGSSGPGGEPLSAGGEPSAAGGSSPGVGGGSPGAGGGSRGSGGSLRGSGGELVGSGGLSARVGGEAAGSGGSSRDSGGELVGSGASSAGFGGELGSVGGLPGGGSEPAGSGGSLSGVDGEAAGSGGSLSGGGGEAAGSGGSSAGSAAGAASVGAGGALWELGGGAGRGGVVEVARAAAEGARVALARTPEQLPALARAGVVDAGGRGLVVLLEAFVTSLTGETPPVPVDVPARVADPGGVMEREAGSVEFGYEVQFLLDAPAAAIEPLREVLGALGDSLVVVGDEPTWHVHVHVNDVGAAIEAGIVAGRPSRITVTRFAEQIAERRSADAAAPSGPVGAIGSEGTVRTPAATENESAGSGIVVVCTGRGLAELLAAEGATVVTGTPSMAEVLAAIRATGAGRVVVLPNDANVLAVATAAAAEARTAGIRAGVVPTRSPVQALAAMAVRDTGRRFEDDVIAMAEAAARCRSAELTVAAREALTVAGRCQLGDVLAIVDGEVNLIGQDLERTACLLLDRMLLAGGELVTLIAGQGAPPGLGETLRRHVAGAWPFVEVQCYEGDQPHYPLLVGVE
ncbi:DAK2 domain-containing protein [Dactylosporangium sp. NPDC050588]|uniref:DAK2 domain-containing protein n=1 Tax=Dactylosporangium sp. NPDC050588 TaxID=3157211 RepID=UPI0033E65CE3